MYTAVINDRVHVKLNDVRDVISYVFSIPLRRAKYSSFRVFQNNCIEAASLAIEFLHVVKEDAIAAKVKGSALGAITRLVTRMTTFSEYVLTAKDKDHLMVTVYNLVLSYEGCGLLNGFGFGNRHGDKLVGNPETVSLYPTEPSKNCDMYKEIKIKTVRGEA